MKRLFYFTLKSIHVYLGPQECWHRKQEFTHLHIYIVRSTVAKLNDTIWDSYVNFKQIKYSNTCQKSKIKIQWLNILDTKMENVRLEFMNISQYFSFGYLSYYLKVIVWKHSTDP